MDSIRFGQTHSARICAHQTEQSHITKAMHSLTVQRLLASRAESSRESRPVDDQVWDPPLHPDSNLKHRFRQATGPSISAIPAPAQHRPHLLPCQLFPSQPVDSGLHAGCV